jgi:hypothetical protein
LADLERNAGACCSTAERVLCCDPAEKEDCCAAGQALCGCEAGKQDELPRSTAAASTRAPMIRASKPR